MGRFFLGFSSGIRGNGEIIGVICRGLGFVW